MSGEVVGMEWGDRRPRLSIVTIMDGWQEAFKVVAEIAALAGVSHKLFRVGAYIENQAAMEMKEFESAMRGWEGFRNDGKEYPAVTNIFSTPSMALWQLNYLLDSGQLLGSVDGYDVRPAR